MKCITETRIIIAILNKYRNNPMHERAYEKILKTNPQNIFFSLPPPSPVIKSQNIHKQFIHKRKYSTKL